MTESWFGCKRILCIRPDNMGDLIMTSPAIRSLKESFNAHITLLTSSVSRGIASHLPCIDEVMVFDVPWVKNDAAPGFEEYKSIVAEISKGKFDGAVIFTVFSQNPLPTAMLAYHAGIPLRLAYCRENPYQLLTHWLPDAEPYHKLVHQVRRDLALVRSIGADTDKKDLEISFRSTDHVDCYLQQIGQEKKFRWVILHPGVSERKREYPVDCWIALGKRIVQELNCRIVVTGSSQEEPLAKIIANSIGAEAFSAAGKFRLSEFIDLISRCPLVISVNTGTVHIAAATKTSVIVLYALTNPQHSPWKATGAIFPFTVNETMQSKNEVLRFVREKYYGFPTEPPDVRSVFETAEKIISGKMAQPIPELVLLENRISAFKE